MNAAFVRSLDAITAMIAQSIHSFRQGGASPIGACHPPESDALFTENWSAFAWQG